jgi:NAD(P)-dependent dehydrogenase (short-subunit alcohol dehydrogenase family)
MNGYIRLTEALAMETQDYGIAVFAIDPGWMSTEMTTYLAESDAGRRWTPWAPSMFGTEVHAPVSRGADLVITLASGRADSLTGRFLTVWDEVDELVDRADEITRDDLHKMRLRR